MEEDHERRHDSDEDVKDEPEGHRAHPRHPPGALAQRIEEVGQHDEGRDDPHAVSPAAGGPQQPILWVVDPRGRGQEVVAPSPQDQDRKDDTAQNGQSDPQTSLARDDPIDLDPARGCATAEPGASHRPRGQGEASRPTPP